MNDIKGVCPVCNGSGRVPLPEHLQKYKNSVAGYHNEDDTLDCQNCGGQYMWGKPTGEVRLNKDGVPCKHEYNSENAGRCLTRYTCMQCNESYTIDSGD